MKTKQCSKCGIIKDISLFRERKANRDGYEGICQECMAKDRKAYKLKNKEKLRIQSREYRINNRDKANAASRRRYRKNHPIRDPNQPRAKRITKRIENRYSEIRADVEKGKVISGIYVIRSTIKPSRIYVGSSINVLRREKAHFSDLARGCHKTPKLQNHYNKYGETDLVFALIEICDCAKLIEREQFYIDTIKPFFNTVLNAMACTGRKTSRKTRKKMREVQLGKKASPEVRQKMSDTRKGRPKSEEWRKKIGDGNKGRTLTAKQKLFISQSKIGKKLNITDEERQKRRDRMNKIRKNKKD